jgi:hypothetical protein
LNSSKNIIPPLSAIKCKKDIVQPRRPIKNRIALSLFFFEILLGTLASWRDAKSLPSPDAKLGDSGIRDLCRAYRPDGPERAIETWEALDRAIPRPVMDGGLHTSARRWLEYLAYAYPTVESRIANFRQYYEDLLHGISLIPGGQDVLDCYHNTSDPRIRGTSVYVFTEYKSDADIVAATFQIKATWMLEREDAREKNEKKRMLFLPSRSADKPGTEIWFGKTITMNIQTHPVILLSWLVHELKHGCEIYSIDQAQWGSDALSYLLSIEVNNCEKESSNENSFNACLEKRDQEFTVLVKSSEKEFDIFQAADECSAYLAQVEFSRGLVDVWPQYICRAPKPDYNDQFPFEIQEIGLYDTCRRNGSLAEIILEIGLATGTITANIYTRVANENFLTTGTLENGQNIQILRPEVAQALESAGCPYTPNDSFPNF